MAKVLREAGFDVDYAITEKPLRYGEPEGGKTFSYHIAPTVEEGGKKYVVDPFFVSKDGHGGLVPIDEWVSAQKPQDGYYFEEGYDINGDPSPNTKLQEVYTRYNENKEMDIDEYAKNDLEYLNKTDSAAYDGREPL